jgi:predicted O-linked N-acetylglucosamine transferase (SPINDLY family)
MRYDREINLIQSGRPQEAISLLLAKVATVNDDPDLYTNLALAFEDVGELARAEGGYRMILSRWPGHVEASVNYGDLLARASRFEEAAAVLSASPHPHCRAALAMVKIEQLRVAEGLADIKAVADESDNAFAASVHLGYSLHQGYDRAAHEAWLKRFVPWHATAPSKWDGNRPIRIGYTGDVFRHCAVASMLEPVLANHDRARFTPYVYSDVMPPDATTERMMALAPNWRDTRGLSDAELAQQIRQDSIDVLIDTQGHKLGSRIMVHAMRPAPIQFTYIGYAGDTLIGRNIDREVGWAYRPSDDAPPVSESPAIRNGFVTFGSVNRAAKINQGVAAAWGRILTNVPTSRLIVVVKGGESNRVARQMLSSAGIPGDRLELVDRPAAHADYLRLADRFDLHLDTFPYGGGATACDMLWQGVPSIVLRGDEYSMGDKLLGAVGLAGLVAGDQAEYVAKASTELQTLAGLRATMRSRMQTLVDGALVSRRLESLCLTAAATTATPPVACCDRAHRRSINLPPLTRRFFYAPRFPFRLFRFRPRNWS